MPKKKRNLYLFNVRLFLIVILAFLSFPSNAESDSAIIKQEVLAAFESLVEVSKKLDSNLYFQHFDEEKFVGLNSDGTNWNTVSDLEPIIRNGFNAINKVISLEFTNVNISVIDNYTAVLVNEYVQSIELKNGEAIKLAGGGAQVWSKRSGTWKIVSISASNRPVSFTEDSSSLDN